MTRLRVLLVAIGLTAGCGAAGVAAWKIEAARQKPRTPRVTVRVRLPFASALDLDKNLAPVLVAAAETVPGVHRVRVVSREAEVRLELEMAPGTPTAGTLDALRARLKPTDLPPDASSLELVPQPGTALRFAIEGPTATVVERSTTGAEAVTNALGNAGLGDTKTCGLRDTVVVRLDPDALHARGVDALGVMDALRHASSAEPEALLETPLGTRNGVPIRLHDVALVQSTPRDTGCVAFVHDVVTASVVATIPPGADLASLTDKARAAAVHPAGMPAAMTVTPFDGTVLRARIQRAEPTGRDEAARLARRLGPHLATRTGMGVTDVLFEWKQDVDDADLTAYLKLASATSWKADALEGTARAIARAIADSEPDLVALVDEDSVSGNVLRAARVTVVGEASKAPAAVRAALAGVPGVEGLLAIGRTSPEIAFDLDSSRDPTVSVRDVGALMRLLLGGTVLWIGSHHEGREVDVRMGPDRGEMDLSLLSNTYVKGRQGSVPLASLVTVQRKEVATTIEREGAERATTFVVGLGVDRAPVLARVKEAIAAVPLAAGVRVVWDDVEP